MDDTKNEKTHGETLMSSSFSRRKFLQYAGASAVAATTFGLVGCGDEGPVAPPNPNPNPQPNMVNLGSGDLGILNYAYALEQLEAAFYIQVMSNPYSGMTDAEAQILTDLRNHEVAHRDWFNAAISSVAPDGIIPGLTPNFDSIDFNSRDSVLATAMAFEDLGVSAYNGAGKLISDTNYLIQAGKIVSVEARHAAAIRSLIRPGTGYFAGDDIIDSNGLGTQNSPADVLSIAGGFVMESINFSGLPTA